MVHSVKDLHQCSQQDAIGGLKKRMTSRHQLTHWFEPEAKRLVYLWVYKRKKGQYWAIMAENIKELTARVHLQSKDLTMGSFMSQFHTLLEEDSNHTIGVHSSGPKTPSKAV